MRFRELRTPLLAGAVCLALPMLLHIMLQPVLGEGSLLFLLFFLSLIPGVGVAIIHLGRGLIWLFAGALLMVLPAFFSLALPEARIFGSVPAVLVEDVARHPAAAGFLLPGAAPRLEHLRRVAASDTKVVADARGQTRRPFTVRGVFSVVPVVGPGWNAAMPVHVVALVEHGAAPTRERPLAWAPAGGVLRFLPDPLRSSAVAMALREGGLTAAPNLVVGRWVASPGWARLEAALPLLQLFGGAWLGWAVLVLLFRASGKTGKLDGGQGQDRRRRRPVRPAQTPRRLRHRKA